MSSLATRIESSIYHLLGDFVSGDASEGGFEDTLRHTVVDIELVFRMIMMRLSRVDDVAVPASVPAPAAMPSWRGRTEVDPADAMALEDVLSYVGRKFGEDPFTKRFEDALNEFRKSDFQQSLRCSEGAREFLIGLVTWFSKFHKMFSAIRNSAAAKYLADLESDYSVAGALTADGDPLIAIYKIKLCMVADEPLLFVDEQSFYEAAGDVDASEPPVFKAVDPPLEYILYSDTERHFRGDITDGDLSFTAFPTYTSPIGEETVAPMVSLAAWKGELPECYARQPTVINGIKIPGDTYGHASVDTRKCFPKDRDARIALYKKMGGATLGRD